MSGAIVPLNNVVFRQILYLQNSNQIFSLPVAEINQLGIRISTVPKYQSKLFYFIHPGYLWAIKI